MVSTVGSQVVYAGLKSGLGASAITRAYAVTIAGRDLEPIMAVEVLLGVGLGFFLGRMLKRRDASRGREARGQVASDVLPEQDGQPCGSAPSHPHGPSGSIASAGIASRHSVPFDARGKGFGDRPQGQVIDSCVPHIGGAASYFEVPSAQEQRENYEYVAENYVKKQNNRKRRATIARGVAEVLASRLGLEHPMEGLPVIQRADGSVGDVGESWWDEAEEVKANRNPKPGFSQYLDMDPDWTAAHPIDYADQEGEGPTLASFYAQVKPEAANYQASDTPEPAAATAAARPRQSVASTQPHDGSQETRVMDLDQMRGGRRTASLSAYQRAQAIRASVPLVVEDGQTSALAGADLDLDPGFEAGQPEAPVADLPLSARIPQVEADAADRQDGPLWEGEARMSQAAPDSHPKGAAVREPVQASAASGAFAHGEYSSLEGKSREEIWQIALDALEEKPEAEEEPEGDFFSVEPVADMDIDDPDGMEQKTAFIPFRVPAGRPEVKDTQSYIDYLLSEEFSHVDSQAVRRNAREYLRVVQGGRGAAYVPDHLGPEKLDKDQREA